jgi:tetratricopeptide (TPR) repeat protein
LDEAIAAFRQAIRIKKDDGLAHYNLGLVLARTGRTDEAIAAYREAVRLQKDYPEAHQALGNVLYSKKRLDEAIAAFRRATRLREDYAMAHYGLALALAGAGRVDEAIGAYRETIRFNKQFPEAHYGLGLVLARTGRVDEAIAAYRETIRLKKDYAEAHCNLGGLLKRQGHFAAALAALRRGDELGSGRPGWKYPSARWVRDCKRLAALDRRLPAVLEGRERPATPAETAEFASLCRHYKRRHVAAARLYTEAFAAKPTWAAGLALGHRYAAACSAALAGCGHGADAGPSGGSEQPRLRGQALQWLRADLGHWDQQVTGGKPAERQAAERMLRHWQTVADLAGVRDKTALAQLPEAERKKWANFWGDVAALLGKASPKK